MMSSCFRYSGLFNMVGSIIKEVIMVKSDITMATMEVMRPIRQGFSRFCPFLWEKKEKSIPRAAKGRGKIMVVRDNSAKMPNNIEALEKALFFGLTWYSI